MFYDDSLCAYCIIVLCTVLLEIIDGRKMNHWYLSMLS